MEPTQTLEMMKVDEVIGPDPELVKAIEKIEQDMRLAKMINEHGDDISNMYTVEEVADVLYKEIGIECPFWHLWKSDEFIVKCCHPETCKTFDAERECWIKFLKFRKENS